MSVHLRLLASTALILVLTLGGAARVGAVPVDGFYRDDPRCDPIPDQPLPHEIGEVVFPIDELIQVFVDPGTIVCVPDDGIANDWIVDITNLSPWAYRDLFFVVDEGGSVGNADGLAEDLALAPGLFDDAFHIDNVGANPNLIFESLAPNLIFEPGETWRFVVTNFLDAAGGISMPIFDSPGAFAGSSAGFPPSNASILATQIPEPSTAWLLGLGLAALAGLRRR